MDLQNSVGEIPETRGSISMTIKQRAKPAIYFVKIHFVGVDMVILLKVIHGLQIQLHILNFWGCFGAAGDADNSDFAKELRDICKAAIETGIKELQAKQAEVGGSYAIAAIFVERV